MSINQRFAECRLVSKLYYEGFLLQGSRRMQQKYPSTIRIDDYTDWDFYADDSDNTIAILNSLGFELKANKNCKEPRDHYFSNKVDYFFDNLTTKIYKHPNYRVEVTLKSSSFIYEQVFESLTPDEYEQFIRKSSSKNKNKDRFVFRKDVTSYLNKRFEYYGVKNSS